MGDGVRAVLALICAMMLGAAAAQAEAPPPHHVQARLIAETDSVVPGEILTLGLRQIIEPGWHTYWINPGDAGEPTHIKWHLPEGFGAGAIQWPAPVRIPAGPLMNFGYSGRPLLMTQVTVPKNLKPGTQVTLSAEASWLVCEEICVPEDGQFSLTLPVSAGPAVPDPLWAADFIAGREALPRPFTGSAEIAIEGKTLRLTLAGAGLPPNVTDAAFFPFAQGLIRNEAAQRLRAEPGALTLSIPAGHKAETGTAISGVLTVSDGAEHRAFLVAAAPGAAGRAAGLSLPMALLFAALGGLILNLMPCVFPVLSMKALMLAGHGRAAEIREARAEGLAYGAGVVLSFIVIAALLLALRGAGAQVGWGFQFQSPGMVAAIALLFLAIGLNLLGVFEVSLFQWAGAGQRAEGLWGAFLTGVLAVLVASPCTAPFMATAIGIGLAAPPPVTLLLFAGLGLGMALPFVLLSASPGLVRLIPKPGPWMARLKAWLALPMGLACLWLVWVLGQQTGWPGLGLWAFGAAGLGLMLGALGRRQRAEARPRWPIGAGLALALISVALVSFAPLRPPAQEAGKTAGLPSERYTPARLAALRAEGRPVFVNLTAAWCITCQVNEVLALSSDRVAASFRSHGVAYLKGDWTLRDPEISALLKAYGRDGVPLYLLFAPGAPRAQVLPQILTEDGVLGALAQHRSDAAALPLR
jgi:thiol:disulfide interchange protein